MILNKDSRPSTAVAAPLPSPRTANCVRCGCEFRPNTYWRDYCSHTCWNQDLQFEWGDRSIVEASDAMTLMRFARKCGEGYRDAIGRRDSRAVRAFWKCAHQTFEELLDAVGPLAEREARCAFQAGIECHSNWDRRHFT